MAIQVLGSLLSIIVLVALALGLRWTLSAMSTRGSAESLTPEDLRVLENAAARLVDDIKQTADAAVRDLDERCEKLRVLTAHADQRLAMLAGQTEVARSSIAERPVSGDGGRERVYALADEGLEADEIARVTAMPLGEVTLLLGLRPCARTGSAG